MVKKNKGMVESNHFYFFIKGDGLNEKDFAANCIYFRRFFMCLQ